MQILESDAGPSRSAPHSAGSPDVREAEFEAAALPHLNDLFRTASRLLGDRERAQDVVQDVYLIAWKSFHKFETGTNCRAWLFKILFNSIHHHRRKWLDFRIVRNDDFDLDMMAAEPKVPEHISEKEILRALDRIPAEFRAVVLLADVEDFAYKEIAGILKVPIGTVMSRLSRGRKLLREHLAHIAQDYGIGLAKREGR